MRATASLCTVLAALFALPAAAEAAAGSCATHVARWLDPNSGETLNHTAVFSKLADSRIVLLGESHTSPAHHRWQAYVLSALHSRQSNMMVGFEMLPRQAQPVLDDWSRGEISERQLLERTKWSEVWGYDANFYLPLLHFSRLNRLPALALNVDRELISRVSQDGWSAVPDDRREGISDPAPASGKYRDSLAQLYAHKQRLGVKKGAHTSKEPDLEQIRSSDGFANFVDAQLTWDRAMAEVLAAAHRRDPKALVVGIVGRGHLEFGYGIPHQLADMGIREVDVLLPIDADSDCEPLPRNLASAVFVVDAQMNKTPPPRPRLGVRIETGDAGVKVIDVVDGSVASTTGIRAGDLISHAAGFETATTHDLIEVIHRQAPGTWLPLTIEREGKSLDLIARFPQRFE